MTLNDYISLFPGDSREKPKLMALAAAVLQQIIDMAPVVMGSLENYSMLTAEGKALDDIGAVFGLSRLDTFDGASCTDEAFRYYLMGKMAYWTWDGSNKNVYDVYVKQNSTKEQADAMDLTVEITSNGTMPGADFRIISPYPAGVSWTLVIPAS